MFFWSRSICFVKKNCTFFSLFLCASFVLLNWQKYKTFDMNNVASINWERERERTRVRREDDWWSLTNKRIWKWRRLVLCCVLCVLVLHTMQRMWNLKQTDTPNSYTEMKSNKIIIESKWSHTNSGWIEFLQSDGIGIICLKWCAQRENWINKRKEGRQIDVIDNLDPFFSSPHFVVIASTAFKDFGSLVPLERGVELFHSFFSWIFSSTLLACWLVSHKTIET